MEIIFDFVFPIIILSIFLEFGNMFRNLNPFSIISVHLIIAFIVLLIIKFDTKLDSSYSISTRFYKWMYFAKILVIWNQILSFTIVTVAVFLYVIFLCILIKFCILPQQFSSQLAPLYNHKKNKIDEEKWNVFKLQRLRERIYLDVIYSGLLILFIGCKEIENHYGFRYSNNEFITFNTILTWLLIYIFSL